MRAGWRVVVFFALWLGCYFVLLLAAFALGLPSVGGMWDPARLLPMEAINLASVVVVTLVIARLERRALLAAFSTCGLPLPVARSHFGEGVVWGATAMTALIAGIAALGGYTPTSLNAIGSELVAPLLVWVVGFAMLGVAEELLPGRLLAAQFSGPDWLTGGSLGPEASALAFPLFAALFVLFGLRQPRISKGAETKWPARN